MKPSVFIDIRDLYHLRFSDRLELDHTQLASKIEHELQRRGIGDVDVKFFARPKDLVFIETEEHETEYSELDLVRAEEKIICETFVLDHIQYRRTIGSSAVLKFSDMPWYLQNDEAPSLVVSSDSLLLATVAAPHFSLRVSEIGELELPESLSKIKEETHLIFDTDDTAFLRFRTFFKREVVLNPHLLAFFTQLIEGFNKKFVDLKLLQYTSRKIPKSECSQTRRVDLDEADRKFRENISAEAIVTALKSWFVAQGYANSIDPDHKIFHTNLYAKLPTAYQQYLQALAKPKHLIFVDDNFKELFGESRDKTCDQFLELGINVHRVRVREQGELLPGSDGVLNEFVEQYQQSLAKPTGWISWAVNAVWCRLFSAPQSVSVAPSSAARPK